MKYALLVYQNEKQNSDVSEDELASLYGEHHQLIAALRKAGALEGSTQLKESYTATTVRTSETETEIIEGPFADSPEQLGGFYLIEVPHLDEALRFARLLPSFTVEIRPIMESGN
ncbi:YciI family protein [Actinomadura sp. 3N407]|uniref:YciI family protein n=1 Tax=Actinomadura sp. 3N407 TaxID=3457423 RepID=UPI003FCDCBAD